jgi:putative ABC transport system permease protein
VRPISGRPEDLRADAIAVHVDTAEDKGLSIGDSVPVVFKDTGQQSMRVALIYGEDRAFVVSPEDVKYFFGKEAYAANVANPYDFQVYVKAAPEVSDAQLRSAVDDVVAGYAGVEVLDRTQYSDTINAQFDPILALVYALLGLAIVIALLGIGNTLALSIVERTRELGLLRAVGMTRSQLRSSIRWESVIIAVQGTLLGLALGLVLGWAFVTALADEGLEVFAVPWTSLLVVVLLGGLAGMLAAVMPSRRAARLDVLRAVHAE